MINLKDKVAPKGTKRNMAGYYTDIFGKPAGFFIHRDSRFKTFKEHSSGKYIESSTDSWSDEIVLTILPVEYFMGCNYV